MKISIMPLLSVLLAVPALADVTLLTQTRLVHARWGGGDVTTSAPDFERFTARVGRMKMDFGQTGAVATQDSTMAPDRLDYAGTVAAFRPGSLAESIYEVGFDVDSSLTFTFDALVQDGGFFGSGPLDARLAGPDGDVFSGRAFDFPGDNQPIHETGLLAPGEYTLFIRFESFGISTSAVIGGRGTAVMTIVPTPQCSADFNNDATVNSQDFFDFLAAFFASDPTADFNNDATVNSQDFFDFLAAFFAGC